MTSINFDELVRPGREASKSLQAEESQGAIRTAAAFLKSGASGGIISNHITGAEILLEEVGKLHQTAAIERTKRQQIESGRQMALAQSEASPTAAGTVHGLDLRRAQRHARSPLHDAGRGPGAGRQRDNAECSGKHRGRREVQPVQGPLGVQEKLQRPGFHPGNAGNCNGLQCAT